MAQIKNSDMSSQQKAELDKEKRKEEKKEAKRAKRQHYKELNEPPKLTVLEEVGNAVTHGIGAGLAIAGFVLLLLKSDTGLKATAHRTTLFQAHFPSTQGTAEQMFRLSADISRNSQIFSRAA